MDVIVSELDNFLIGLVCWMDFHLKANDLHVVFNLVQETRHMHQKKYPYYAKELHNKCKVNTGFCINGIIKC